MDSGADAAEASAATGVSSPLMADVEEAGEAPAAPLTSVICCYTENRWEQLVTAIGSVQQDVSAEVLVVVDHNDQLWERLRAHFGTRVRIVPNRFSRGLSGARNTALFEASTEVVAFLDDDAEAPLDWGATLMAAFADVSVAAVGGGAVPVWPGRAPRWFPEEFGWVVGCSYVGMPTVAGPVRNVIGCNMAVRREQALAIGGFSEGLGRTGADVAGCEETLLCIELTTENPGSHVRFLPDLKVRHSVSADRVSPRYLVRRCFGEGRSKAVVVAATGSAGLSAERSHAIRVLPLGVVRGVLAPLRGDLWGPVRAATIVVGTVSTAIGYLTGRRSGRG